MFDKKPSSQYSPLHKKAIEIYVLSKNISQYLVEEMAHLNKNGNEHPNIYFTGDIVQQSGSLFPEIIKAEEKTFSEDRHKHIVSVKRLTQALHNNCERLEKSIPCNGKDFIKLLQNEIKRFRKLQRVWSINL